MPDSLAVRTHEATLTTRPQRVAAKDNMSNPEKRLRIGVLFGGRSGEHEVSLASAASVIRGLDPAKYEPVPIAITKEGHWRIGVGAQKMLPEVLRGGDPVMMTADPTDASLMPLKGGGASQRLDVIFPVM